jgi:hypothetical protein
MIEDALENCVSAFDGFGREICRRHANIATNAEKANSVSFQNMDRAALALGKLYSIDLRSLLSNADWLFIVLCFSRRHILAHNSGVIDEKYISESGDLTVQKGRRIDILEADVVRLSEILKVLGLNLAEYFSKFQGSTEPP